MASQHDSNLDPLSSGAVDRLNRSEGAILYGVYAVPYSAPVMVNKNPVLWSPAKLKLLAAEVLRRHLFIEDFAKSGGLKTFGKVDGRFNGAVVRVVGEEPFFGFLARLTTWLKSNPQDQFPALPTIPRRGNEWSVQDLVKAHQYYVPTPERPGTGTGNPDDSDSDSSVEVVLVKKTSQ